MSRSQKSNNDDSNKILRDSAAKGLESAIQCTSASITSRPERPQPSTAKQCRPKLSAYSDGSVIKPPDHAGLKQKLVNKVKSWSSKDNSGLQRVEPTSSSKPDPHMMNVALEFENLGVTDDTSEVNLFQSDLLRAKDSLENLLGPRSNKTASGNTVNSRSFSYPASSQEKHFSEPPHSDSLLTSGTPTNSSSRVLAWDPWNKLGRKNKKEKKRKSGKSPHQSREASKTRSPIMKNKDHTAGDEPRANNSESLNNDSAEQELQETYEYQPYRQNKKTVDFVNEVLVVYFTGDEVISRATEPLKKELDQQIRNKEMRRGHVPCTMIGKKHLSSDDYMSAWFKR